MKRNVLRKMAAGLYLCLSLSAPCMGADEERPIAGKVVDRWTGRRWRSLIRLP